MTTDYTNGRGHGTAMLSKIVGHQLGVAKRATPIIVRVPRQRTVPMGAGAATSWDYLDAVSKVVIDVGGGKKAILSMSWYFPRKNNENGLWTFPHQSLPNTDDSDGFRVRLRMLLRQLVNAGVSIICGSGNDISKLMAGQLVMANLAAVWITFQN
ncbi:hypothetical protein EJ08DRAFT_478963 [Tothia fuscella]|uniref:Uncharacterized protein n=1 Tax=Tothia fuscella TaxID=1048955 RepID=A0A9P4TUC9_9PEZI|nr:hypothetical protein EJ08DRAFT_478963 [Tothia fuscella]